MSKDIQFDSLFRDNPVYIDYFLNSVTLVADTTVYDGTSFSMDYLNLIVLNISVINVKDWYVSYNVSDAIDTKTIDFIINKCKLKYEFIDRYNSSNKQIVYKQLLIGK